MKGKSKCKILKEIRRQIAANNDIAFVTTECKFQGECTGTCPKCEAEVRYLEGELLKRQRAGKAVVLAGLTATLTLSALGCTSVTPQVEGDVVPPSQSTVDAPLMGVPVPGEIPDIQPTTLPELTGEPAYTEPSDEPVIKGLLVDPSSETTESSSWVLTGDIAYPPEEPLMGEPAE